MINIERSELDNAVEMQISLVQNTREIFTDKF